MKKLIFTLLVVFIASKLKSQTQIGGSVSTTIISGSSTSWSNLSDAVNDDDTRASSSASLSTIGNYTDYIVVTNFGFSVPAANLIEGIQVNVDRRSSSHTTAISDNSIRLVKNGVIIGDDNAYGGPWSNSDINYAYGGATDLWGETWDPSDVNNANFGVAISSKLLFGLAGFAEIDNVTITISSSAPLPVELSFFNAALNEDIAELEWQTTSEIENDFFEIQKSSDGVDFEPIGIVGGKGNSIEVNDYQFVDINVEDGLNYYRLKQVDFDGSFDYSSIKVLRAKNELDNEVAVYPNPSSSNFRFTGLGEETNDVQIFSLDGALVKEATVQFQESIQIGDLPSGTYFVQRKNINGVYQHKLIVK